MMGKIITFILFMLPIMGNASGIFPLSTCKRFIVDKNGYRFKLIGINWYGAQEKNFVNEGLNKRPLKDIVKTIKKMGFNTIRLPFSNEMLTVKNVDKNFIKANPELFDKTPLQIFDEVIKALTDEGIAVILNNYSSKATSCCLWEEDGLWYTRKFPEGQWIKDWVMLANRYSNNPGVVAVDLRNEVRVSKWRGTYIPAMPRWGSGSTNDWKRAAERAGNEILKANPKLLIIVEGINFPRYHLRGIRHKPVQLIRPSQLVYSVHNYAFNTPKVLGPQYGEMKWAEYKKLMDEEWGFLLNSHYYDQRPVWLSEFGIGAGSPKRWFDHITRYMDNLDVDFAYWPLNAGLIDAIGKEGTLGLLEKDWKTKINDWRSEYLKKIMGTKISWDYEKAKICASPDYQSLPFDISDAYGNKDLSDHYPDFFNANCADDSRVVGLSVGKFFFKSYAKSVLCSRKDWNLRAGPPNFIENTNQDSNHRTKKDWAKGYTKLECGPNQYITAITQQKKGIRLKITGIQCGQSLQKFMLSTDCQARVMENKDDRAIKIPTDWSHGYSKGQCASDEYMAGISAKNGSPHSILCCIK